MYASTPLLSEYVPWNILPTELVMLDSVDKFKRGLDKLWLEGTLHFQSLVTGPS